MRMRPIQRENMFNDEFVSSCGHTFDLEKMREFWNIPLRRIKDYAEAVEREAEGAEETAETQSNAYKSRKQEN